MQKIFKFLDIDSFDNLEELKELKYINLMDIPYNLTILDKEETYDKLNYKDKKFKKISKEEKRKYLYKVLKKLFKEKLKSCIFDEYLFFLETSLIGNDKIYFMYNDIYIDFFINKAYYEKNKKLIEYEEFDFSTINYEDIESICFISNKKIINIIKEFAEKDFRKHSKEILIKNYIEDNFAICSFLDYYLEEAFELYDDEMFENWLDYVNYNDFLKEMKEEQNNYYYTKNP